MLADVFVGVVDNDLDNAHENELHIGGLAQEGSHGY